MAVEREYVTQVLCESAEDAEMLREFQTTIGYAVVGEAVTIQKPLRWHNARGGSYHTVEGPEFRISRALSGRRRELTAPDGTKTRYRTLKAAMDAAGKTFGVERFPVTLTFVATDLYNLREMVGETEDYLASEGMYYIDIPRPKLAKAAA